MITGLTLKHLPQPQDSKLYIDTTNGISFSKQQKGLTDVGGDVILSP